MIELIKNDKYSLLLKIPKNDVSYLYNYLDNLGKGIISVLFNGKKVDLEIIIDEMNYDLIKKNNSFKLYMDYEEIEFFKYRLNEVIKGNGFYPSELCDRKMKNIRVTIYCLIE